MVSAQNPREIAARILREARAGAPAFTEERWEHTIAQTELSPADRALCRELVFGCVRWRATLDWLVARKTGGRKQNPALQNLLRLGLYQIFWLDKIPPHAAVHETVELTRRLGLAPQAGFVNALLRAYLREFDATEQALSDLKISDPALGFSHPRWLVEKWLSRFGVENTRRLLEWNNTPAGTFARLNTLKLPASADPARPIAAPAVSLLLDRWREEGVTFNPVCRNWLPENLVFELKSHPPLASLGSLRDGWFYIQDPGTLLAPLALNPQPGEVLLDLCAAPGGKTTFLAQQINNVGRIVACDVSEKRRQRLRENCLRLGAACVEIAPRSQLKIQYPTFDRILIDAPCSNTGVLRRRVDLRWRLKPEEISRLQQTQLDLLQTAPPALKPGGVLLYSTCSLEPEENVQVVDAFLREHRNFRLEFQRQLLPFADAVDGAFVARLQKSP